MPGINDWSFKLISEKRKPFHNSMDGTRVIRTIELYENGYLVGESFPADIRLPHNLPNLVSREQVQEYVYFLNLVDTTGELPDIMLGSFPEATSGVYAVMLKLNAKQQLTMHICISHWSLHRFSFKFFECITHKSLFFR